MANKNREKEILLAAYNARKLLSIHGFVTVAENDKIFDRLLKYKNKNKIAVTQKDLDKAR